MFQKRRLGTFITIKFYYKIQTHQMFKKSKRKTNKQQQRINNNKNAYLLRQTHNLQIFGVNPFVKLQDDT